MVFVALALLSGCAGATAGGGRDYDPDLITREEIQASPATSLWDVINELRPRWLQVIEDASFSGGGSSILVYRDNVQLPGPEALRTMTPEMAVELRWLDRMEAASMLSRAGASGQIAGAIVIVTRTP
jgi:hypothetical protein